MSSVPLNFQLEVYEGPLDLLLDLIRKQKINIYEIPIARITAQYLEYVQKALDLNIELGAEFVYMAATLIHIKSRMLLPRDPELEKMEPEGDPRADLVQRLLEHERFRHAAEMLRTKRDIEDAMWSNPQISRFLSEGEQGDLPVTLFDLVQTLQGVLERVKNRPHYDVSDDDVTVPEMIRYLRGELESLPRGRTVSARDLFDRQRSRRAMICLFLAILEMVRLQAVQLVQKEAFGEIMVKKSAGFEQAFASEQALAAIQEEYSK